MELTVIIKIDKNTDGIYAPLWAEAYQTLAVYDEASGTWDESLIHADCRHEDKSFHSMEEYFAHIGHLREKNLKFLMLPIDEPDFVINANTRTITPQKIVILEKDHMAEMIMFTIDRYFDYKDLNEAIIYVQWTLPNGETGAAPIEVKDIETTPGKIRFGWPLDDSITSVPGTVQYSVRFWNKDGEDAEEQTVTYSLNTLSSSLTITKALQPAINDLGKVINPNKFFEKAVRNSQYSGDGTPLPLGPVFYKPATDLESIYNLDIGTDSVVLSAEAMTSDAGELSYSWYFTPAAANEELGLEAGKEYLLDDTKDTEGNVVDGIGSKLNCEINYFDYQPVDISVYKLTTLPGNVKYYVEGKQGTHIAYTSIKPPALDENGNPTTVLYRRYTTYTINSSDNQIVGQYHVKATNTLGKNTTEPKSSSAAIIPGPSAIVFTTKLANSAILTKATDAPEGTTETASLAVELAPDPNGTPSVVYKWLKNIEDKDNDEKWLAVESNEKTLTVSTPGWYKMHITTTLNRAIVESESENNCLVTFLPVAPTMSFGAIDGVDGDPSEDGVTLNKTVGTEVTLTVNAEVANAPGYDSYSNKLFSEKINYQWIMQDLLSQNAKPVTLEDSNAIVVRGSKSNQLVIKPTKAGSYNFKCEAVNELNGNISDVVSKSFVISVT